MLIIVFLALLWVPVVVSLLINLSWDLKFWQQQDFRSRFLWHSLQWDFNLHHRRRFWSTLKVVAFGLIASAFITRATPLPAIGAILAYGIYVFEFYDNLYRWRRGNTPWQHWQTRTWVQLALTVALAAAPAVWASHALFQLAPKDVQTISDLVNTITVSPAAAYNAFSSGYIYALGALLWAVFIDFTSPLWATLSTFLLSPFVAIRNRWVVNTAADLLKQYPNLVTIATVGSYGKSTVSHIANLLLQKHFKVLRIPALLTEPHHVAEELLRRVSGRYDVVIFEIQTYQPGELQRLFSSISPNLVVFTGIDRSHSAIFGSKLDAFNEYHEALQLLPRSTKLIINADDPLTHSLVHNLKAQQIWYSASTEPGKLATSLSSAPTSWWWATALQKDDVWQGELRSGQRGFAFQFPGKHFQINHSMLAGVIVAGELGIRTETALADLATQQLALPDTEIISADNGSEIILSNKRLNIARLRSALGQYRGTNTVLITDGLKKLGSERSRVYQELAHLVKGNISAVITPDRELLKSLHQNNASTALHYTATLEEMVFAAHKYSNPGMIYLCLGEIDPFLIAELRREN